MSDWLPLIRYGSGGEFDGATFARVCPKCGRFVKSDELIMLNGYGQPLGENASCKKCGRVTMPFQGYFES